MKHTVISMAIVAIAIILMYSFVHHVKTQKGAVILDNQSGFPVAFVVESENGAEFIDWHSEEFERVFLDWNFENTSKYGEVILIIRKWDEQEYKKLGDKIAELCKKED